MRVVAELKKATSLEEIISVILEKIEISGEERRNVLKEMWFALEKQFPDNLKIYAKDFDYFSDNITLCHFFNVVSTHIHRHYGNALPYEVTEEMFHKIIRYGLSTF